MSDHKSGGQVVLDHESTEDSLADDTERKQRTEKGEVPAIGPAEKCQQRSRYDRQPHEAGQQAISVLDPGVDLRWSNVAAVAFRPVGASQPGGGEADGGAGEDDEDQGHQSNQGDLCVAFRRYLDALQHGRFRVLRRRCREPEGALSGSAAVLAACLGTAGGGHKEVDQLLEFLRRKV